MALALEDSRRRASCVHDGLSMLQQRVYGLALGYEDLNDHESLRRDQALQTAVDRVGELASASTLCRWEDRADREAAWRMHEVLVDQFIDSFRRPPKELILDFDATDDAVHGRQDGGFFHGYYDHYCFLPLYVFCKDRLLVSYLRPSKIDGACLGDSFVAGEAISKDMAEGTNYLPGRFRLLPLADVILV